jgi:hydroxymethylbilane synthase
MRKLRVGSRGSELALVQTRGIMARLHERDPDLALELEIIRTRGDIVTDVPLSKVGDRGLFIKEIETALTDGRIDIAVHSMKDVPSQIPDGLVLAATTERLDPRDVLIARGPKGIEDLPKGGVLATGSLRRRSQALALRPDLSIVDLRGNVTTRLKKFEASSWDGMLLAGAGLERLGLAPHIAGRIPTDVILPAVGQGALALEARRDDRDVIETLLELDHVETAIAVRAERAFLRRLEGGCQVPVAALGSVRGSRLLLEGYIGSVDGRRVTRQHKEGPSSEPEELGTALGESILAGGGAEILEEVHRSADGA